MAAPLGLSEIYRIFRTNMPSSDRAEILREKRRLCRQSQARLIEPNIEAPQALRKMPRNVDHGGTAPMAVRIRQSFEQFRCCAGKGHLKMEGERIFAESCHERMRTNMERFVNLDSKRKRAGMAVSHAANGRTSAVCFGLIHKPGK
uniref:hypothetical protein n=2 Tax=Sphingomonas sp. GlSt437 TaxID=3389970 RepID=UPI003A895BFE